MDIKIRYQKNRETREIKLILIVKKRRRDKMSIESRRPAARSLLLEFTRLMHEDMFDQTQDYSDHSINGQIDFFDNDNQSDISIEDNMDETEDYNEEVTVWENEN